MKHFIIILFVMFISVSFMNVDAFAKKGGEGNNTGCNGVGNDNSPCEGKDKKKKKAKKYQTINNSAKANAKASALGIGVGIGLGGAGGKGGNATVKNSGNSNNRNTNVNLNGNKNTNTNSNKNTNANLNANSNKNSASSVSSNSNDVDNTLAVNVVDASVNVQTNVDFNHITPDIGRTNAELVDGKHASEIKRFGVTESFTSFTKSEARMMSSTSTDIDVLVSIRFKAKSTDRITLNMKGRLMGSMILSPTGSDITFDGLNARAALEAMKVGATGYAVIRYDSGLYHSGSKAGFDLGGAASAVAKSDGSVVIAPGATMGYSHAWSSNEYRPGMAVALYHDGSVKERTSGITVIIPDGNNTSLTY